MYGNKLICFIWLYSDTHRLYAGMPLLGRSGRLIAYLSCSALKNNNSSLAAPSNKSYAF